MELDPISCLLPWDLFEKILNFLGCPHICYHITRQLCQKTRNELLPRLVDWYFVEWWWTPGPNSKEIQCWKTVSCVWKSKEEKHMKITREGGGKVKNHLRFCVCLPENKRLEKLIKVDPNGVHLPVIFLAKETVETNVQTISVELSHVYESENYVLGGYMFCGLIPMMIGSAVRVGDYVLTECGKFKKVVETGVLYGSDEWVWFRFKNENYNMYWRIEDWITVL